MKTVRGVVSFALEQLHAVEEVVGEGVLQAGHSLLATVRYERRAHALEEVQSIGTETLDELGKVLDAVLALLIEGLLGQRDGRSHGKQAKEGDTGD